MPVLHIVNKSPFDKNSLVTCLRLALADSSILLIEDGIYAAQAGTACAARVREALDRHRIYALEPDLRARGIDPARTLDGITLVDYDGFVELTAEHDRLQSWL